MTDIVERLRYSDRPPYADDSMLVEAAAEIERLRTEHAELLQAHTALVARLHDVTTMLEAERATQRRLKAMRDGWDRDAREHLNMFGQHLPASVSMMVEHFDVAMQGDDDMDMVLP
jgi:hypothetical protein